MTSQNEINLTSAYRRLKDATLGWKAAVLLPTSPMENRNQASLEPTERVIVKSCSAKWAVGSFCDTIWQLIMQCTGWQNT